MSREDRVRARPERTAQPRDADLVGAERRRERDVVGDVLGAIHQQPLAQLVPLDLIRGEDRHEVVDVGARRDEHRERLPAVPAQRAAAATRAHDLPRLDRITGLDELREALAEHDPADLGMQSGRRPAEYANAARSGSGSSAPRCRLEREYKCDSSNARTRTSPDARSKRVIRADIKVDLVAGCARRLAIHGPNSRSPIARECFSWRPVDANQGALKRSI